ncbi:very-long-chain (3R)-3-hydroxyacyl-CoA dehydratase 1 isoform X2 [Pipistrellus kuhlii]|uniref:very-long-chain (3R)-3-hydroxyacyl-CoA dehydratase 1 isoform X2 n=1 Tax=Pipistrellus kuhlii TaxID=59472 RepID=UPI00174F24B7|nr:very-long-chain (3R)-3-hydroxyacyl-CoA dehydratase 1 isoform X2 [Pipistrellus kuhlii]
MGRWTEAAAAGGGASAASSAGPPCTPLPLPASSPGGAATMAFSEEDGSNGGASEASEEREAPGRRRRLGWAATAWLTFYNIAMTAGWLVLAITMVRFYMEKGTHKGLYKSIQKTLKFFQTFALLEIVHCLIGIVPTSVLVAGVQVSSRIFMVWLITHSIKPIQNEESVVLFLVAWTVTEITRYSFYTFSLLNHLPYFIKWASGNNINNNLMCSVPTAWSKCRHGHNKISVHSRWRRQNETTNSSVQCQGVRSSRRHRIRDVHLLYICPIYNFFIILYPVGVAGELLTIYAALPHVKKSGMYSIRLPNKYNISFDYYYFLLITMASYIPLFPQLYFYMLRQRRKVLHGEVIVEKDD